MRLLTDQEKALCCRIIEGHNSYNCIQNIIDQDLMGVIINVDNQCIEKIEVQINIPVRDSNLSSEETKLVIERVREIFTLIVVTLNLVDLLHKEGYIIVYQSSTVSPVESKFGQGVSNSKHSICANFTDKKYAEMFANYLSKEIIVTPEFTRFCNEGFIARDEQRFIRTYRMAIMAFVLSLLGFLYNVLKSK